MIEIHVAWYHILSLVIGWIIGDVIGSLITDQIRANRKGK